MSKPLPTPNSSQNPIDQLIYDPAEAVTATMDHLKSSREAVLSGLGLHFPIPEIAAD